MVVLDNLSRPGVEQNLRWLGRSTASRVEVAIADVRDRAAVRDAACARPTPSSTSPRRSR